MPSLDFITKATFFPKERLCLFKKNYLNHLNFACCVFVNLHKRRIGVRLFMGKCVQFSFAGGLTLHNWHTANSRDSIGSFGLLANHNTNLPKTSVHGPCEPIFMDFGSADYQCLLLLNMFYPIYHREILLLDIPAMPLQARTWDIFHKSTENFRVKASSLQFVPREMAGIHGISSEFPNEDSQLSFTRQQAPNLAKQIGASSHGLVCH